MLAVSSKTSEDRWHRVTAPSFPLLWAGESISGTHLQCFPLVFFFFFFFLSGEGEARVRGGAGEMDAKERAAPLPPAPPHSLVFVYLLCARHKADYTFVRSYFQKKERRGKKDEIWESDTRLCKFYEQNFEVEFARFLGTVHRNEW